LDSAGGPGAKAAYPAGALAWGLFALDRDGQGCGACSAAWSVSLADGAFASSLPASAANVGMRRLEQGY
jgi:hypothetical protein